MPAAMQPPNDPPPPAAGRWVSFAEAQRVLGMSEGTLRRAIRDGTITAEQRRRTPGSATDQRMVYEVLVMDPPAPASAYESDQPPPIRQEPPAALSAALGALTAALDSERAERQNLAAEVADLRERAGRAEALAEQRLADKEQYAIDLGEQTERAIRAEAEVERLRARRWWRWW